MNKLPIGRKKPTRERMLTGVIEETSFEVSGNNERLIKYIEKQCDLEVRRYV